MAEVVHPGSCKSNAISRICGGSRAQTRMNEERSPWFNRYSSAAEGDVTAGAASPVAGELVTAETWRSAVWPGWGSAAWLRVARHLAGRARVGRRRPRQGRPVQGLRHLLKGAPVTLRQRSVPAPKEGPTVAAFP